jgi:hypothetical protein
MTEQDWENLRNENATTPDDITKAMQTAHMRRRTNFPTAVPAHMRRQTNFPTTVPDHMRRQTSFSTATQPVNIRGKAQYDFPESDPWGFRQMEDERATPRSPQKIGMLEAYRRRFYKPATRALQGYSIADLNRMNFLGGYYSEPAREARRFDKRGLNVLDRWQAGKKVGNVTQLLGKYGYEGGDLGSGDISFTGKPIGDPNVGTGYSRSEKGWQHSSFRGGGLASLWPR